MASKLELQVVARDQASRVLKDITVSIKGLNTAAGSTKGNIGGMFDIAGGNLLSSTIQSATRGILGLGKAFAGTVAGMVSESSALNAQISSIGAIANASSAELAQIKGLINDLGVDPKLQVSATEAADAIEMLMKNGLTLPDVMGGAARSTVLLANSTGADFATAADIATDAMSLFNIAVGDMDKAVNGVVGVTQASKFGINDYALALGNGAKGAVAAGISFDQFNQMLTATASNFTSGMTAGTGLTAMMLGLTPSTEKAKKMMRELGIITKEGRNRFFDMNGEVVDNIQLSRIMRDTLGRLTTEQRLHAVDTLFGRDAMAAINGMIKTTDDSWQNYAQTLESTDAEKAAAQRMDNLAGDMEIFSGVMESMRTQIGDEFEPALRSMFQGLTPLVSDLTPKLVSVAGLVGDWVSSIMPSLEGINRGFIMPALNDFIERLQDAKILSNIALKITGDSLTSQLAGLAELTGGDVDIDAVAKVVKVDWLSGGFTHVYDAGAMIVQDSVLWGAWSHTYDVKAQVTTAESVLWGAWTHTYDVNAKVDEKSIGWGLATHTYNADANIVENRIAWGLVTHTYDAGAQIKEDRILWGLFTNTYDVEGRVIKVTWGDFKLPPLNLTPDAKVDELAKTYNLNWAEKLSIRFAPGIIEFLKGFATVIKPPATTEMAPLLTMQVPTLPADFWPAIPTGLFAGWPAIGTDLFGGWPSIATSLFEGWPAIPRPDWLNSLLNWRPSLPSWLGGSATPSGNAPVATPNNSTSSSGSIGGQATGTDFFKGGWTWVGEKGPELLNLPRGSRILSNNESMKMIGQLADGTMGPFTPAQMAAQSMFGGPQRGMGPLSMWDAVAQSLFNPRSQSTLEPVIRDATDAYEKSSKLISDSVDGASQTYKKATEDLKSALQSVPGLFNASPVTAEQMELAKLGVPQNFADDYLRRLTDEVMNGVDWEGVDLQDAAARAGIDASLPAEAILKLFTQAWNDSSLFANEANKDLINMDAVQTELARQAASKAGEANILKWFGIEPEQATTQVAALGSSIVTGLTTEMAKPENADKLSAAVGGLLTPSTDDPKAFTDVGDRFLTGIADSFSNTTIDFVGRMGDTLRGQINLPDSIKVLQDLGAKILEFVFQGYFDAAKGKEWASATVQLPAAATTTSITTQAHSAIGASSWRGGLTWVGETGPELVALPARSRIFSPDESMAMAGGGGDVYVTIHATVANDIDIQSLAYRVGDVLNRRRR